MYRQDYLNCIFDILNANGVSENERYPFVKSGLSRDAEYQFNEYFWGERYSFDYNELTTTVDNNKSTCDEINEQLKTFAGKYNVEVENPTIETVKLLMDEPNFVTRLTAFMNEFIDELQNAGEASSDN